MKYFLLAVLMTLTGCVSATVSDSSVSDQQQITYTIPELPSDPVGVNTYQLPAIPPVTTTFNFSETLSKITSIANDLSISVNQLSIDNPNNELSWVQSAEVQVSGQGLPQVEMASYTAPHSGVGNELDLQVTMKPDTLLQYMQSGPLTLTITVVGGSVSQSTLQMLENLNGSLSTNISMDMSIIGNCKSL